MWSRISYRDLCYFTEASWTLADILPSRFILHAFFLPSFLGTNEYLNLKTVASVYGNFFIFLVELQNLVRKQWTANWALFIEQAAARGSGYLTGCSEVSQKIFRLEISRNRFYTSFLLFTAYLLLGEPIKGCDGNYPVYITGMPWPSRETTLSKGHQWLSNTV